MLKPEAALRKDTSAPLAKLQHRHFATIAALISEAESQEERNVMAQHFALRLKRTNPNFNPDRFIAACLNSEGD